MKITKNFSKFYLGEGERKPKGPLLFFRKILRGPGNKARCPPLLFLKENFPFTELMESHSMLEDDEYKEPTAEEREMVTFDNSITGQRGRGGGGIPLLF